ncbi:MAG: cation diffusion facilitator family transporter [Bacteroidetes bacterium]|nr:cation diffusion facilitator family transporter [Bacteroidota bacterium]
MENAAQLNIRIQRLVVAVSLLLFFAKILAYWITHSVAILTDALESTVNVLTGFTGLYSLIVSARPRDGNHPYGHGKVELVSASFEGLMIIGAGILIVYEAILNLLHPPRIDSLDYGIYLVSFTAVVNFALGAYCINQGHKNNSIALRSSGKHLQSDTYTTLGIIVGLILIRLTGITWIDSASAILFGSIILFHGYGIIRQTVSGIMDEVNMDLIQQLIQLLNDHKEQGWIDLHNLRMMQFGHQLHLDCHLTVPWYCNVATAQQSVRALENLVAGHYKQSVELFVHIDPCKPPQACRICEVTNCPERQAAFETRLNWTFDNLTQNHHHE